MGFLDRFRRETPQQPEASAATAPAGPSAGPAASSELLSHDAHVAGGQAELLRDSARDLSTLSGGSLPSLGGAGSLPPGLGSASPGRLYNPYEGLNAAVDARGGARPAYKLPAQPEYLFSEEATVHKRSWSENLTFYTGTGYLSGAVAGGGVGVVNALRARTDAAALAPNTARLRVNRLLNMGGRTGRSAGNALGVLGLLFSSAESGLAYATRDMSLPDSAPTLGAGFLTGAVFRSARGLRTASVAGGLGLLAASGLVAARHTISHNL